MIRYNANNGLFVANGPRSLREEGWDWYSDGGKRTIYSTDNVYKVVPHYDKCDEEAQEHVWLYRMEFDKSWADRSSRECLPVPPGQTLFPYQSSGVSYALQRRNTIIGDEPGLGKTAQAIVFANTVGAKRVLVVCPASLRLNWKREIEAWSTLKPPHVYPIVKGADGVNPFANYVIVSYDLARNANLRDTLCQFDWDVLVLDEAHYLKTPEAGRTRAIFGHYTAPEEGLAYRCARVLALTGTPLPNRPKECYTLVRSLNWGAFDKLSEEAFLRRYNPTHTWHTGHRDERTGHLPEMRARLRCNLMVRRLKKDVLKDLPAKRYELLQLDTKAIRDVVAKEKLSDFDPAEHLTGLPADEDGHIATLRREMSEAIAPEVVKHAQMLLDGGLDKLLIGFYHRKTGDILQEGLKKWGLMRIDGRTSVAQRQKNVDRFQNNPEVRVGLLQTTAAGVGVTLTAASHMVVADPDWTPGNNEQLVDRMHRIGQRSAVLAQFPVGLGSWNEYILSRAIEKLQTTNVALDGVA